MLINEVGTELQIPPYIIVKFFLLKIAVGRGRAIFDHNIIHYSNYTWFVIVRVRPIPMEVDDVGMLELSETFEHLSDLVLLGLVVFALRELHLVPHHLHAFLGVHGQVRAVDSGNISLLYLRDKKKNSIN